MLKRREVRETAFLLVFEELFRTGELAEIIESASLIEGIVVTGEVEALFRAVTENADMLDAIIARYSDKRAIDRIPRVNMAILRLALYEALFDEKVPLNVAISEAVILAKGYAQDPDVSFINGVLGAFSRSDDAVPARQKTIAHE
ncbi:MAG: transcription antitermination factor NusB [Oscillospiraceae bacterium]